MAKASKPKKPTGRPRVLLDEAVRKKIYEVLQTGGSRADAAARAQVTQQTITNESKRDPAFLEGLTKAEFEGKWFLILKLRQGANADPKWAAWMLERKWPDDWAKRKPDEITPERLARVIVRLVTQLQEAIPAKYHAKVKAAIDAIIGELADGRAA